MSEKKNTSKKRQDDEIKEDLTQSDQANEQESDSETESAVKGIETLFERVMTLTNEVEVAKTVASKEKARADDMKGLADRLQADFDNYRKRTNDNVKKLKDETAADTVEKFLPVLDALNHGIAVIKDESAAQGLRMIAKQFTDILLSVGVEEINALGEQFDPNLHNAVMQEPATNTDDANTVSAVFTKGYKMGERVVRHSVVKVKM